MAGCVSVCVCVKMYGSNWQRREEGVKENQLILQKAGSLQRLWMPAACTYARCNQLSTKVLLSKEDFLAISIKNLLAQFLALLLRSPCTEAVSVVV